MGEAVPSVALLAVELARGDSVSSCASQRVRQICIRLENKKQEARSSFGLSVVKHTVSQGGEKLWGDGVSSVLDTNNNGSYI